MKELNNLLCDILTKKGGLLKGNIGSFRSVEQEDRIVKEPDA